MNTLLEIGIVVGEIVGKTLIFGGVAAMVVSLVWWVVTGQ